MNVVVRRSTRSRRGAVILLLVLAVPLFVGMLTIALDLGWAYLQESRLRDAGQAAATAGANTLAAGGSGTDAKAAAKAFALANGIQLDDADVIVNPYGSNSTVVRVKKTRRVSLFWGPLIGWNGLDTNLDVIGVGNADTTQLHMTPTSVLNAASGVIPLGIPHADFMPVLTGQARAASQIAPLIFGAGQRFARGRTYLLKTGSQFKIELPGLSSSSSTEGPLDLPGRGNGAAKFRSQMITGVGAALAVGDLVATQPGNLAGPTREGVDTRVQLDPSASWSGTQPFSARVVVLPIVRTSGQSGPDDLGTGVPGLKNILYVFSGNHVVQVIGLAKFFLDPYSTAYGPGVVTGVFLEYVGPPPQGQGPG